MTKVLKRLKLGSYRTGDLNQRHAQDVADLTDLPYADASFDAIVCNHVLEHIPDDQKAMAEMHRVLRPDGQALLMFPTSGFATTDEDATIVDRAARTTRWGHPEHVRRYGADVVARLEKAGFSVQIETAHTRFDAQRFGLRATDPMYICKVLP